MSYPFHYPLYVYQQQAYQQQSYQQQAYQQQPFYNPHQQHQQHPYSTLSSQEEPYSPSYVTQFYYDEKVDSEPIVKHSKVIVETVKMENSESSSSNDHEKIENMSHDSLTNETESVLVPLPIDIMNNKETSNNPTSNNPKSFMTLSTKLNDEIKTIIKNETETKIYTPEKSISKSPKSSSSFHSSKWSQIEAKLSSNHVSSRQSHQPIMEQQSKKRIHSEEWSQKWQKISEPFSNASHRPSHLQVKPYSSPILEMNPSSKIPHTIRQSAVNKLYQRFVERGDSSPHENALKSEKQLLNHSPSSSVYLLKLKSILNETRQHVSEDVVPSLEDVQKWFPSREKLIQNQYPMKSLLEGVWENESEPWQKPWRDILSSKYWPKTVQCDQCQQSFEPLSHYSLLGDASTQKCHFHPGKMLKSKGKIRYSCCQSEELSYCQSHPFHTYGGKVTPTQQAQWWHHSHTYQHSPPPNAHHLSLPQEYRFLALDAEMVHTTLGWEVGRLTVVQWNEKIVLDVLMEPYGDIVHYNTIYSGLNAQLLKRTLLPKSYQSDQGSNSFQPVIDTNVFPLSCTQSRFTLHEWHTFLSHYLIHENCILIGHQLDSDLRALKWIHNEHVLDTVLLFPHPREDRRYGLKRLMQLVLGESIQSGEKESSTASVGHDSIEDAKSALKLVKKWLATRGLLLEGYLLEDGKEKWESEVKRTTASGTMNQKQDSKEKDHSLPLPPLRQPEKEVNIFMPRKKRL